MQDTCARVKQKQFSLMGLELSVEEVNEYSRFADGEWNFSPSEMDALTTLIAKIKQANDRSGFIPQTAYNSYLASKFFHVCYNNPAIGKQGWTRFQTSDFSTLYTTTISEKLKFRIKTLLA